MPIETIVFLGKSKKKTGNTRFMFQALNRRVPKAIFINVPRTKKLYFWTNVENVIYRKIQRADPDLVLIYSKDIPYGVLQRITPRYTTALFYPDVAVPLDDRLVRYGRLAHYCFITNKTQIPELREKGVNNPVYCMQGCDRSHHCITPTRQAKWASDVAFVGRPSTDYRIQLLRRINKRFDLKVWGARWQDYGFTCPKQRIYPKEYAKICYRTPIILGCDYRHDMEGNFSNRTWITLGCGGFLLTSYSPGLEQIFAKGEHLEWYDSQEECLDLIDYYLDHEEKRKQIAVTGYEFAHTHRTYDIVVDELISRIEADYLAK
jgi:hypothetical protein